MEQEQSVEQSLDLEVIENGEFVGSEVVVLAILLVDRCIFPRPDLTENIGNVHASGLLDSLQLGISL